VAAQMGRSNGLGKVEWVRHASLDKANKEF
jgi:hypothetical protein